MKRILLSLLWGGLGLCLVALPGYAQSDEGRDPENHWEIEGHFGFYTNLKFPTARTENPAYTTFLTTSVPPALLPLFRPDLRQRDFRWQGGYRVSYDFKPQWALEYGMDVTQGGNLKFNDTYVNTVMPQTLAAFPTITVRRFRPASGRIWIHSLNLIYHIQEKGRFVPYITGGLNTISFGRGPLVDYLETVTSSVAVFGYEHRFTRMGANVGGGIKYYATRHIGLRTDVRFLFAGPRFVQGGFLTPPTFGPVGTSHQSGLYSNLHWTFGVFGRF